MANEDTLRQLRERQGNWPTIEHGQDTVSTAGSPVALNGGTSLSVPEGASVSVRANSDNAGTVYIGDSSVSASTGFEKTAGDGLTLNVEDVSTIHVDADNGGDGVSWIVEAE